MDSANAPVIAGERDCPPVRTTTTTVRAYRRKPTPWPAGRPPNVDADHALGALLSQLAGRSVTVRSAARS